MAIYGRMALQAIIDEVRKNLSEWDEDAGAYRDTIANDTLTIGLGEKINIYVQSFRQHMQRRLRAEGISMLDGNVFIDWYKADGTISVTSGSADAWLPEDYDGFVSCRSGSDADVWLIQTANGFGSHLRSLPNGEVKYLKRIGYASNSGTWQRKLECIPTPGFNDTLQLEYYRLPADMNEASAGSVYPDIHPAFCPVIVDGVTAEMMGAAHRRYGEFRTREGEGMLSAARDLGVV